MLKNYEDLQKIGTDGLDVAMKQFGVFSKGAQAIASEVADYSKQTFEASAATAEKLVGAKSLESAIAIQTDFVKSAYEGFVARSTKLGSLYADLAKETYKPFEGYFGSAAK